MDRALATEVSSQFSDRSGYPLSKSEQLPEAVPTSNQLCLDFDTEQVFNNATIRIRPTRDIVTITAVFSHRSAS